MEAKIEIEKFDDYAIIHLSGPFVSSERDFTKEIKGAVKSLLDEGFKKVLMDFEQVTFYGSDGIGALTNSHYTAANIGARVVPYALPEHIKSAFHLVGLDKVFPNFDTLEDTLVYLKNKVKD